MCRMAISPLQKQCLCGSSLNTATGIMHENRQFECLSKNEKDTYNQSVITIKKQDKNKATHKQ